MNVVRRKVLTSRAPWRITAGSRVRSSRGAVLLAFASTLPASVIRPATAVAQATTDGAQADSVARATPAPRRTHPEARAAISRLRSPFCPGLMLEVCPSPSAAALRDSIQGWALGGTPADSIVEAVLAAHGEEWRAEPRPTGFGLLAWLLPPAFLIAGVGAVGVLLRARSRGVPGTTAGTPAPEELERLAVAMARLDEEEAPDW